MTGPRVLFGVLKSATGLTHDIQSLRLLIDGPDITSRRLIMAMTTISSSNVKPLFTALMATQRYISFTRTTLSAICPERNNLESGNIDEGNRYS